MKKFFEDFKAFAMKGNAIDMAVGIIIGGAFGKIVSSLVNDIIMPPIGMLIGGMDFADLRITLKQPYVNELGNTVSGVYLNYGAFIQTAVDFLIIAFSIFLIIKAVTRLSQIRKDGSTTSENPTTPPTDVELLSEIRDLLKEQKSGK